MVFRIATASLAAFLAVVSAAAQSTWIPVVARESGFEGTQWRSDVAVVNTCPDRATVTLILHSPEGDTSQAFEIEGGRQQLFEDVVWQLLGDDGSGSLEIRSQHPVTISSRTFNQTDDGTFGQSMPAISEATTLAGENDTIVLPQLRQDDDFRTNIGALNTGTDTADLEIVLSDRLGTEIGRYQLQVPAGQTVLDTRPFLDRFARDDVVAGRATVNVLGGHDIWAFASVVDQLTGDPMTVAPLEAPQCPLDIAERLASIPGLLVQEGSTPLPGYRYFELFLDQPADHNNPDGPTFRQYMTLLHRDTSAPMVMYTAGYYNSIGAYRIELTDLLGANQLVVEHRFFGSSTPASGDWSLLDIEQAATDHHRVVEALKPIYGAPWVNTGASKGGMTAVYHRRFFPDDVDATVAYVAPISFGAPDERYLDFVATRGEASCRQALSDLQREALERRDTLVPMLETWASVGGYTFDRIGGVEAAFEAAVIELPFTFWQYSGAFYCRLVPDVDEADNAVFAALRYFSSFWYPTDDCFEYFAPYFYQAHHQLGFPAVARDHLQDLLQTDALNLEEGLPPAGTAPEYDGGAAMQDIADWVATNAQRILFIYGENDPWTAGAFALGEAEDCHIVTVASGNHGASISDLNDVDRALVDGLLHTWTGVRPTKVSTADVLTGEWPVRRAP